MLFVIDTTQLAALVYVPVATRIESPLFALSTACWIVRHGDPESVQVLLVSEPVVAT